MFPLGSSSQNDLNFTNKSPKNHGKGKHLKKRPTQNTNLVSEQEHWLSLNEIFDFKCMLYCANGLWIYIIYLIVFISKFIVIYN